MLLRRVSILAALTIAIASSAAHAVPSSDRHRPISDRPERVSHNQSKKPELDGFENRREPSWVRRLNLSDAQKQQIREITGQNREQLAVAMEQLQAAQTELRSLLLSQASDRQILAKHSEVLQLRERVTEMGFKQMLEIRALLNPEQREAFLNIGQDSETTVSRPNTTRR